MKRIIIIGAGPAGLTAAVELLKRSGNFEVVIFEESNTVGGISRTVNHHGNRMDIGGHRFFSKDERVVQWWKQYLPVQGKPSFDDWKLGRKKPLVEGGPDPEETDLVMLIRDRISRIFFEKKFFDYPISLNWRTVNNLGLARLLQSIVSYIVSTIRKRPENSLDNFYINRFGSTLYHIFFEGYTEKLWGRHPRNISADWGSQRVKGLSIRAVVKVLLKKLFNVQKEFPIETSLIEQFYYPKYGPGQLWERVAEAVIHQGAQLRKNCQVISFSVENDKIDSVKYLENGTERSEKGDIFISSMPLKDLIQGMPEDKVPENIQKIATGLPYRDFVTIGLLVRGIKLLNETAIKTLGNIVPDCWIYVQDTSVKLGRIQIFNNWSPYMVQDPENTIWIGLEYFCQEGDEFWNLPDDDSVDYATRELIQMGILDQHSEIMDSHREKVRKAYPAYFDTYDSIDQLVEFLNTISNLYCIGRNGQHRYNNMDHSMVTAFETVNNIISGAEDRSNIWNVNTDKAYHEEK
jgi:protoporphyrinogen oxidase